MKSSVLLGKNFLSYLISFALFERNKKVILAEDQNFQQGKKYIWEFEKILLNTWGLDCQIQPLLSIEEYLSPSTYTLVFDGVFLNLGSSPSKNFNEIWRKFPGLFSIDPLKSENSRKNFDRIFKDFYCQFGVKLFRFIDQKNFNMETVWPLIPREIKDIFFDFKINSKKEGFKFLLCFFQGVYQNRFFWERDDFSLLFILLFLLSPRFELNVNRFEEELFKEFNKKGGEVYPEKKIQFKPKGPKVEKIVLDEGKPQIIEKLFLTCGEFGEVSLIPNSPDCYFSILMHLGLKSSLLLNNEFFVSSSNRLGGNNPMTRFWFEKDGISGEVIAPFNLGTKISLEEKRALEILLRDIEDVVGDISSKGLRARSNFSQNFFSGRDKMPAISWPFFKGDLKNLKIYHQSNLCPLGNLSLFTQIKDERGHIL